jgi:integrase
LSGGDVRGSIRTKVKGKRYEVRVALGRDPKTGRYRQKSLTVHGSRAEAERALRHLLEEVETGAHEDKAQGSVTFGELLDEWLAFKVSADRSPTTIARYRASIELHLRPSLGTTRLDRLKTKDFDDLYRELTAGLKPATILKTHLVARAALDRAVRWGWIDRNPASAAEPPVARRPIITPPDPGDLARLLLAAQHDDPVFALFLRVGAATGARRGELCALRWSDIDLDDGTVTIERGVIVVDGGVRERSTKTHNRRTVALDRGTLDELQRHLEGERAVADASGSTLESDAFVFSRRPGGTHPLRPDNCTSSFQKLLRQTGLSGFSLKDATRHLVATRLIAAGVDVRTVAGRLGHARASTTLDIYSHWLPGRDREAASILGQLLDDPDEPGAGSSSKSSPRRI